MQRLLDFCGECGTLQPEGKGLDEKPTCANCGHAIKERENRIQGVFENQEAERFMKLQFGSIE